MFIGNNTTFYPTTFSRFFINSCEMKVPAFVSVAVLLDISWLAMIILLMLMLVMIRTVTGQMGARSSTTTSRCTFSSLPRFPSIYLIEVDAASRFATRFPCTPLWHQVGQSSLDQWFQWFQAEFPNFSWRGYAGFSQLQDEVLLMMLTFNMLIVLIIWWRSWRWSWQWWCWRMTHYNKVLQDISLEKASTYNTVLRQLILFHFKLGSTITPAITIFYFHLS